MDDSHILKTVNETYNIRMTEDGLQATDEQGICPDQSGPAGFHEHVGIPASFWTSWKGFPRFLDSLKEGDVKSEYLLPRIIDDLYSPGVPG